MKHHKPDANQAKIVAALRKCPAVTVETDHHDILVGYNGVNYWFEIKTPDKVGADGLIIDSALRDSEKKRLKTWKGQYSVVWDVDQIFRIIGIYEQKDQ